MPRNEGAPPARQRYALTRAMVRTALNATALLFVYYLMPLDRSSVATVVGFVGGILVLLALITHQVRAVTQAPYPLLRSIESLATSMPLYLLLFAGVFLSLSRNDPAAFTEELDRTGALYFALTVFATVGFGDISAVTDGARVAVMLQMTGNLIVIGLVARVFVRAVQIGQSRARPTFPPPAGPTDPATGDPDITNET